MTQCHCEPEVDLVHLFTLATMAVCFAADFEHNNHKDKCLFFRFPRNTKEYEKREDCTYQILIPPNKEMTYAIAIINKTRSWETVRRESMPRIAEVDVKITTYAEMTSNVLQGHQKWHQSKASV